MLEAETKDYPKRANNTFTDPASRRKWRQATSDGYICTVNSIVWPQFHLFLHSDHRNSTINVVIPQKLPESLITMLLVEIVHNLPGSRHNLDCARTVRMTAQGDRMVFERQIDILACD